jgi:hypothetical protein
MREKLTTIGVMGVAAAVILAMVGPAVAGPLAQSSLQGGAPTVVSYQGQVTLDGAPYTGDGYFKLAIVDTAGSISYWSNDGSSTGGAEPATAVQLAVSDGLFSVLLGDTTVAGMTQPLTASVFSQPDCYLRVWFSTNSDGPFEPLAPDTHIAAVPYALQAQAAVDADTVDGLHASELGTHYQSVIVVGQGGGDYASVQAAIDSITDATESNPYLVWVAPGLYEEQVTMKPHVHLQGAGQGVTVITSHAGSSAWPPDQATLLLASDTSLCNLTVQNTGVGDGNAALLAMAGMTRTLVAETTARALGSGVNNFAIAVVGSPTGVNLQQVAALAENGSNTNIGRVRQSERHDVGGQWRLHAGRERQQQQHGDVLLRRCRGGAARRRLYRARGAPDQRDCRPAQFHGDGLQRHCLGRGRHHQLWSGRLRRR